MKLKSPTRQRRPAKVTVTTTEPPQAPLAPPANHRFVGAHVSAAGGADRAIASGHALGSAVRSAASFVRPRLSWQSLPPLSDATVAQFRAALATTEQIRLEHVAVHGSYLLNLATHDPELRAKSVVLMTEEVTKCAQLGVPLYVFHPGSCTGGDSTPHFRRRVRKVSNTTEGIVEVTNTPTRVSTRGEKRKRREATDEIQAATNDAVLRRQSLSFVAESVAQVLDSTETTTLVVETMSGQGNVLGSCFDELHAILAGAAERSKAANARGRLGVCLDTCHVFASGWALDSEEACEAMMRAFYASMGSDWSHALKVVHVNDSHDACGSRTDRHANIGRGNIGLTAFRWLMNAPHFANLPLILETPRAKKKKKAAGRKAAEAEQEEHVARAVPSASEEIALLYSLVESET